MLVLIKLTSAGVDAGPFNLYSNTDGYVTPFATGISKATLLSGYLSSAVPNGSTVVRCLSTGTCTNYVDFNITTGLITTTTTTTSVLTTTTTTTPAPGSTTTSTTTPTPGPPVLTKILVEDKPAGSTPVQCDGTIPPSQGTTVSRYTTVSLLDQYNNLIAATSNITAVINYIFDQCGSTVPVNEPHNFPILIGQSISSEVFTYAKSTLVDCGQSNCEPEYKDFDAPVSNTAGLPFTVIITP
jgi:hypothetical protein